jgi:hypothetical protein
MPTGARGASSRGNRSTRDVPPAPFPGRRTIRGAPGLEGEAWAVLVGRNGTVGRKGITVIDRRDAPGITGGALDSHEGLPGLIYLQTSEKGQGGLLEIL